MYLLNHILKSKQDLDKDNQLKFDMLLGNVQCDYNIMERVRMWMMQRLELHMTFENIPNEKKNLFKLGLETAVMIFNNLVSTDKTYEIAVSLLYGFVNEIFSIPTINKYLMPMLARPEY